MTTGALVSKDELIVSIAKQLAASPRLDPNWRSLAIVFTFEGKNPSNFGYCYTGAGPEDWAAFSNREDDLDDEVASLRETMAAETGHEWKQGLFQLVRESGELDFEFAYDAPRWKVTPQNVNETIEALRP